MPITTLAARGSVAAIAIATMSQLPAMAQQSADATIGEIIVTAQKREQSVSDVPQSVAVITGEELSEKGITSLEAISAIDPALKVSTPYAGGGTPSVTLRGLGPANQYNFNTNAPIGFYMDEVYQSFVPAPAVQFFDLERVEVLKGPQGTLYGRNTTGGLINFISKQPALDGDLDGLFEAGYGNRDSVKLQGATTIPLEDGRAAARISFLRTSGDGYIKNARPGGNRTFMDDDTWQVRGILRVALTEALEASLTGYYNRSKNTGAGPISPGIGPGGTNLAGYSRDGLGEYEAEYDYDSGVTDTKASGATFKMVWDGGPLSVTSITSATWNRATLSDDCDGSPISLCAIEARLKGRQFSQDVRVNYNTDKLNLVAGVFYGEDKLSEDANIALFNSFFPEVIFDQNRTSYAGYVDGSYALSDKIEVTLGLRQTFDKVSIENARTLLLTSMFGTPVGSTVPAAFPYQPGLVLPTRERSPNKLTGRAILKYNFNPDMMAYASYSFGYRVGAFNGQALASPDEINYVDPETVKNYELGFKGALFDRRLTLAAALFNVEIDNQHVQTTQAALSVLGGLDGYSRGFELEADAAVGKALRLNAALSLMETRYKDGQVLSGIDVSGNRFALAPKFAAQGGFDLTAFDDGLNRVELSADATYSGQYFFEPLNGVNAVSPILTEGQQAYTLVDARIAYTRGQATLAVWGRNLTDKYYRTYASNNEGFFGNVFTIVGVPRSYGVSASLRF